MRDLQGDGYESNNREIFSITCHDIDYKLYFICVSWLQELFRPQRKSLEMKFWPNKDKIGLVGNEIAECLVHFLVPSNALSKMRLN